ncbi:hypothetical protein WJX73_007497 [Symbiochloris irregularis]|uniref:HAUS augmin-like complex subunit 6 N-terminal domain-containing protein n=1 Tax=Symbiochloris irregularis TaxID=706552 RepID=A0AAW1PJL1_9CHLO
MDSHKLLMDVLSGMGFADGGSVDRYGEEMLAKQPNTKGLEVLLHFLFQKYKGVKQAHKELQQLWPVEPETRRDFKEVMLNFVLQLDSVPRDLKLEAGKLFSRAAGKRLVELLNHIAWEVVMHERRLLTASTSGSCLQAFVPDVMEDQETGSMQSIFDRQIEANGAMQAEAESQVARLKGEWLQVSQVVNDSLASWQQREQDAVARTAQALQRHRGALDAAKRTPSKTVQVSRTPTRGRRLSRGRSSDAGMRDAAPNALSVGPDPEAVLRCDELWQQLHAHAWSLKGVMALLEDWQTGRPHPRPINGAALLERLSAGPGTNPSQQLDIIALFQGWRQQIEGVSSALAGVQGGSETPGRCRLLHEDHVAARQDALHRLRSQLQAVQGLSQDLQSCLPQLEAERDELRRHVNARSQATTTVQIAGQGSSIASGAVWALEGNALPDSAPGVTAAVRSMLSSPCEDICSSILQGYPGHAEATASELSERLKRAQASASPIKSQGVNDLAEDDLPEDSRIKAGIVASPTGVNLAGWDATGEICSVYSALDPRRLSYSAMTASKPAAFTATPALPVSPAPSEASLPATAKPAETSQLRAIRLAAGGNTALLKGQSLLVAELKARILKAQGQSVS